MIDRRLHRVIDVGVIAFEVLVAVQPRFSIEGSTRMIMLAIAAVHAVALAINAALGNVGTTVFLREPKDVLAPSTADLEAGLDYIARTRRVRDVKYRL